MPINDHYTVYLHKLQENDLCLEINRNYYYNDLIREGEIINYDQSIKEIIQAYNEIIFIYEKYN